MAPKKGKKKDQVRLPARLSAVMVERLGIVRSARSERALPLATGRTVRNTGASGKTTSRTARCHNFLVAVQICRDCLHSLRTQGCHYFADGRVQDVPLLSLHSTSFAIRGCRRSCRTRLMTRVGWRMAEWLGARPRNTDLCEWREVRGRIFRGQTEWPRCAAIRQRRRVYGATHRCSVLCCARLAALAVVATRHQLCGRALAGEFANDKAHGQGKIVGGRDCQARRKTKKRNLGWLLQSTIACEFVLMIHGHIRSKSAAFCFPGVRRDFCQRRIFAGRGAGGDGRCQVSRSAFKHMHIGMSVAWSW